MQRAARRDVSPLFTRCLGNRRRREDVIDFSRRVGVNGQHRRLMWGHCLDALWSLL